MRNRSARIVKVVSRCSPGLLLQRFAHGVANDCFEVVSRVLRNRLGEIPHEGTPGKSRGEEGLDVKKGSDCISILILFDTDHLLLQSFWGGWRGLDEQAILFPLLYCDF